MPNLRSYDVILVNSSGGKDSQAMLDYVVEQATISGVADRVVVVHADLGRVEWPGTRELAARQAACYGVPFEVVQREQNDLLDQVKARGMWPSSAARYCTSDQKRAPIRKLMTKLVKHLPTQKEQVFGVLAPRFRKTRILNCMGIRAEESAARAKKLAFEHDESASNGKRHVDNWLPIFEWKLWDVWARIYASPAPWHYAYNLGMQRLSCVFCIFTPEGHLVTAGKYNKELLAAYVAVEKAIGHKFRINLTLQHVEERVNAL